VKIMVWLIDDLVGAAFSPWGLAVTAGVSVAMAARKRRAAGIVPTASAAVAGGREAGERVQDRVKASLAEIGDWWSDLYAEARAEWEQEHAPKRPVRGGASAGRKRATAASRKTATPRKTAAPKASASRSRTPSSTGKRVRDASGRYVKSSTTA
jgi:hypothetical protein